MKEFFHYFFGQGETIEFENFTLAHFLPIILLGVVIFLIYKFRDKIRVYGDTDVDGKHTGTDMGKAIQKRIDIGGFVGYNQNVTIKNCYKNTKKENGPSDMFDGPFIYIGII